MSELETRYISNGKYDTIQDSFRNEVSELSKKNKIILIYPIPEVGWDPLMKMWIERKNKFSKDFDLIDVSTSYEVYKDRTKSTFELFDSINNENIFRVYPHELFCDTFIKDRCVTHNKKVIFYSDSSHPSTLGAEMINELIINEIESIELKSR